MYIMDMACALGVWLSVKNALMNVILLIHVHTTKCTGKNDNFLMFVQCNPNGSPYFINIDIFAEPSTLLHYITISNTV